MARPRYPRRLPVPTSSAALQTGAGWLDPQGPGCVCPEISLPGQRTLLSSQPATLTCPPGLESSALSARPEMGGEAPTLRAPGSALGSSPG